MDKISKNPKHSLNCAKMESMHKPFTWQRRDHIKNWSIRLNKIKSVLKLRKSVYNSFKKHVWLKRRIMMFKLIKSPSKFHSSVNLILKWSRLLLEESFVHMSNVSLLKIPSLLMLVHQRSGNALFARKRFLISWSISINCNYWNNIEITKKTLRKSFLIKMVK